MRHLAKMAVLAGILMLGARVPAAADDFYAATPADLQGPPGSLIRVEGMSVALTDAHVYRILYRSTGLDGRIIPVSGFVVAPYADPPAGGWPVIAWAHPTTGIAQKCAPTVLFRDPVSVIPGVNEMLSRGFVIVATDYPGLGAVGPHPYLVGVSEGRAVLDSVRAARELREARAGDRFAVWGHSQGGQAALYTGILAAAYAPELKLVGVAAAAPATELAALFNDDLGELAGRILGALVVDSWSEVFNAPMEPYVDAGEIPDIKAIGENCIDLPHGIIDDLLDNKALPRHIMRVNPTDHEPWKSLAAENTPGRMPAGVPVFIAQGTADTTVDPKVTVAFVGKQCAAGVTVKFTEYPGLTHIEIAKAAAGEALQWMIDRFEGRPASSSCGG